MILSLMKEKNFSHIVEKNRSDEFDLSIKFQEVMAVEELHDIMCQYKTTWGSDHENRHQIESLYPGNYTVNEGDFTYCIKINE